MFLAVPAPLLAQAEPPAAELDLQFDFLGDLGKNGLGFPRAGGGSEVGGGNVVLTSDFELNRAATMARINVTARVAPNWHVYSVTQQRGELGGPLATRITVESPSAANPTAAITFVPDVAPETHFYEDIWPGLPVEEHEGTITWSALVPLAEGQSADDVQFSVKVFGQVCKSDGACIPFRDTLYPELTSIVDHFEPEAAPPTPAPPSPRGHDAVAPAPGSRSLDPLAAAPSPGGADATRGLPTIIGGQKLVFWQAILFGILGGFILNAMPCVLPVIGLKVLAFAEQGGQSRSRVLALNLWYTAGLMSIFLLLATLAAFLNLGWGALFGMETFRYVMLAGVFAMGLSFLGVWEIPIPGFAGGSSAQGMQEKEGAIGAFSKGVFTTILATPCSGPFLAGVFLYTVAAPWYQTYLIFASIGFGMALPYIAVGIEPRLVKWLPKPGAWMETFKQSMGFVLLATAIYLFSTVYHQGNVVAVLTMLLGLAVACWWIGRVPAYAELNQKVSGWVGGIVMASVISFIGFHFFYSPLPPQIPGATQVSAKKYLFDWEPYSPEALDRARAQGKTVMIDFTASWCPNCHYNMQFAINTPEVRDLVEQNEVVPMIADWSDYGDVVRAKLNELGSDTIPFLAIYPGQRQSEVIVLPNVITKGQLVNRLEQAGPSRSSVVEKPLPGTEPKADSTAVTLPVSLERQ
jgi:thiol:disulfide interchange protein